MNVRIVNLLAIIAVAHPTILRGAQVPFPTVCAPATLGHNAVRFRGEFNPSFAEAPFVDSIVDVRAVNTAGTQRSALDSVAVRQLRARLQHDSSGVFEALAGAIVDQNVSLDWQADVAARYYKALGGSPARLFAAELNRFGYARRPQILSAIRGPVKDDEWPVILGYTCDAIAQLSALDRDSSYWEHRDIGPDRISLEFILRTSGAFLPSDVRRSLAPAVTYYLGD